MKNIFLIAFFFLTAGFNSYALFDWFPDSLVTGEKLDFKFLTLQSSQKQNQFNYGVSLCINRLPGNINLNIKTGTLSFADSFSRLNSPALSSSISPFSSVSAKATEIGAYLPSHTSFSNPFSVFTQIDFNLKRSTQLNVNGFFIPDSKAFALSTKLDLFKTNANMSLLTGILSKSQKQFSLSFTTGLFPMETQKETSWVLPYEYFNSCFLPAFQTQFSFADKKFSTLNTVNLYVSPFYDLFVNFRSENSVKIGHIKISLSSFYNYSSDYLTPSNKRIDEKLQFKINFLNQKLNKNNKLFKAGFTAFTDSDLLSLETKIKLCAGTQISCKKNSFTNYITCNLDLPADSKELSITDFTFYNKNSFYFNKWNLKLNESFCFTLPEKSNPWKTSQKISLQLTKTGTLNICTSGSLEMKEKNWTDLNTNFTISASCTYKPKIRGNSEFYASYSQTVN